MIKFENLWILITNIPRLTMKRRRLVICLLLAFLIISFYLMFQNVPQDVNKSTIINNGQLYETENIKLIEYKKLINDVNIDTSSYIEDFIKYFDLFPFFLALSRLKS